MSQPQACFDCGCPLAGKSKGFALGSGDPKSAKMAILLETPASNEISYIVNDLVDGAAEVSRRKLTYPDLDSKFVTLGAPVVGPSGNELFGWALKPLGLQRSDLFIENVLHCVGRRTAVWMGDGLWKSIDKIITGDRVKSFVNGEIVDRAVLGITRSPNRERWMSVDVDGGHRRNQHGNGGVYVTPDHEWITPDGRIATEQLQIGQKIYLPQCGSDALLHGTLLGDGHVTTQGMFLLTHTNKGWLEAKAENLGRPVRHRLSTGGYRKVPGDTYSLGCTIPREWRNRFYSEKQKLWVPPNVAALAIFYGDDGCLHAEKHPTIALHKFTRDDRENVAAWFRHKFGSVRLDEEGNIFLHVEASVPFFEAIAPYLHPSMEYKLPPFQRGKYNGWMSKREPLIGKVLSVQRVSYEPKKNFYQHAEMCLVVEEARNFFTRVGLVSNCWPPKGKTGSNYPTGVERKKSEGCCLQTWNRLDEFAPTAAVVTFHPAALLRDVTPLPVQIRAFERAKWLMSQGHRVVVCCGGKAAAAWFDYAENVSRWSGHFQVESDYTRARRSERWTANRRLSVTKVAKVRKLTVKTALLALLGRAMFATDDATADAKFDFTMDRIAFDEMLALCAARTKKVKEVAA